MPAHGPRIRATLRVLLFVFLFWEIFAGFYSVYFIFFLFGRVGCVKENCSMAKWRKVYRVKHPCRALIEVGQLPKRGLLVIAQAEAEEFLV